RRHTRFSRDWNSDVCSSDLDGSYLAFFEAPHEDFQFKQQADYDLHIALEVDRSELEPMMERGKAAGIETRGISDHAFIDSIYFRDPNGYVIDLTAKQIGRASCREG